MNAQTITPAQLAQYNAIVTLKYSEFHHIISENIRRNGHPTEAQAKQMFLDTFAVFATEKGKIQPMTDDEANEFFKTWSDCADAIYFDIITPQVYFKLPAGTPVPEAIVFSMIPGIHGKSDIYLFDA